MILISIFLYIYTYPNWRRSTYSSRKPLLASESKKLLVWFLQVVHTVIGPKDVRRFNCLPYLMFYCFIASRICLNCLNALTRILKQGSDALYRQISKINKFLYSFRSNVELCSVLVFTHCICWKAIHCSMVISAWTRMYSSNDDEALRAYIFMKRNRFTDVTFLKWEK